MEINLWFKRKRDTYRRLFDSEDGKWVLTDLYNSFGRERISYEQGGGNHAAMAYRDGQKSVLQFIRDKLNMSDEELITRSTQHKLEQAALKRKTETI